MNMLTTYRDQKTRLLTNSEYMFHNTGTLGTSRLHPHIVRKIYVHNVRCLVTLY